ncbi:TPA: hypothetical protein KDZ67_002933 [Vibrio parahaemolyticus]|uniref:hypothetical protein n=1 Tax=Vibrio parahaemolyticus TaxID=670 RepID=UPI001122F15B|nr:hypothetical protein [Vibrio parahaemolyticus]EJE8522600.1 hypothetical protein [Vibrio parahaemolyticus]MBE3878367.1 hypothetical protein [Vibrio parahaemolyticus]MBE4286721.1 hypothetical protein [Vibrio parahaemolyticus]MDF4975154.1 hypothetical protein [Vibrio parahaemolyticus]MDF5038190.1 hypothetical protein [Vibrio parahaemolyticus]
MENTISLTIEGKIYSNFPYDTLVQIHGKELVDKLLNDQSIKINRQLRESAYEQEADKLFMEWQYDQTPESEAIWRSKVAEIKARYPLPVES